jgi:rhamnosyltransferase subunit B
MNTGRLPLRFLFNPSGTAGDVYPYLAIGMELKTRGHEVFILTNSMYQDVAEKHGLNFVPIGEPIEWAQMRNESQVHKPQTSWKVAMKWGAIGTMQSSFEQIAKLQLKGRTVIGAPAWSFGARIARDALQLPLVTLVMNPFILRSTILPPVTPGMYMPDWMPRWMKLEQYWFADTFLVEPLIGKDVNAFRAARGLPRVRRYMNGWWFSPDLVLGLFHELYVPRPSDWPGQVQYVGHTLWDPEGNPQINSDVQCFLESGPPPVCFVPGSVGPGFEAYYSIVTETCRALGVRGLILDKADARLVEQLPPFMKHAAYSPLKSVLPKCQAVVHSGCMGTSAQTLRAGLPHIVRPRVNDQPDMARRLERLGVAKTLPVHKFRVASLTEQLRGVLSDNDLKIRCNKVSAYVQAYPPATQTIADCFEKQAMLGHNGD